MERLHVAVVGTGEVGSCYAAALGGAGHAVSVCDIRPTAAMHALAERLGTTLHGSAGEWLARADVILVCVPGGAALHANLDVLRFARSGVLLLDTTTAAPQDKRQAAQAASAQDVRFADVAIMGLIASTGERTPLLCAGTGVEEAGVLMRQIGAPVRILPGDAGDAISLKLLRSIITKGLEALAVEALTAAEQHGVREELYEVLSDLDDTPIRDFLNTLVRTHVVHAQRRRHEVAEAAAQLRQAGLPTRVLPGVEALFAGTVDALREQPPGTDLSADQVIGWLLHVRSGDRQG